MSSVRFMDGYANLKSDQTSTGRNSALQGGKTYMNYI